MMAESSVGLLSTLTPLANLRTIAQAKEELNSRLTAINNDLQLTQSIGLLLVKREEDLKNVSESLQLLNEQEDGAEAQPLPESFLEQLVTLDRDFQEGDHGVTELRKLLDSQMPLVESSSSNGLASRGQSALPSSALPSSALPAQVISRPRRHRAAVSTEAASPDAGFPVQIQEELLNQVRYWTNQAEMKERQNQEFDIKIQDQERIIDVLHKQRRLREESDEKQKEDMWNLELRNQELKNQNTELQGQLSKAMHENAKYQKAAASATELAEQFKGEAERTTSRSEASKVKFEQDLSTLRTHSVGLQRDKKELLEKIDELTATNATQQQKLVKATQEANDYALALEERDREKQNLANAPPILIVSPSKPATENDSTTTSTTTTAVATASLTPEAKATSLARETSFAHQQSIINDLKTKLDKEVTEKVELLTMREELLNEKEELVKILADREEMIENMRLEAFEPEPPSKSAADQGLQDDSEGMDHLGMVMSENGNPSGGLFAELAQANSKPVVEYKDQEVMTEPIESWIRDAPEVSDLLKDVAAKAVESAAREAAAEQADVNSDTINGKPGMETKRIGFSTLPEEDDDEALPEEVQLDKPKRRSRSAVPIDEERRHTCDLSQVIADSSAVPPVPGLPKEHAPDHLATEDDEDREFRVSFGSAFGGHPNATDTGRIRSVYLNKDNHNNGSTGEHAEQGDSSGEGSSSAPVKVAGHVEEKDQPVSLPSQPTVTDVRTARPMNAVVSVASHATYTYEQNNGQALHSHLNSNSNNHHYHVITDASGATVGRQPNYRPSPEGSVSSLSTDYHNGGHYRNGRRMSISSNYDTTPTDLTMIQSITQTMIGDYLLKYTRRRMTNRMSEKCHRRYVWVHPYNKTLHWSLTNPGGKGEQRAKSANIVDVTQESDENANPHSDQLNVSLVVHTTTRTLKLKAPTREKHDLWFQSIRYLLTRPSTPGTELATDNQTWSEIQDNGNHHESHQHFRNQRHNHTRSLSASSAHLPSEALSMRPIEKPTNAPLRKKGSMARLQSMLGRVPNSKEGSSSSIPSMISPKAESPGTGSPVALHGITTTAAAVGHENGSTKSMPTSSGSAGLA